MHALNLHTHTLTHTLTIARAGTREYGHLLASRDRGQPLSRRCLHEPRWVQTRRAHASIVLADGTAVNVNETNTVEIQQAHTHNEHTGAAHVNNVC